MAYNSMSLHPNHMIKGLSCRQEARLQIILLLLSMVLTYTCAIFKTTKTHKTLHQFCGSLYPLPHIPLPHTPHSYTLLIHHFFPELYSGSNNCPNVWPFWKDWLGVNQVNYTII